jgi:histidyl-tRNA synthetase
MRFQAPRGTQDILPSQSHRWRFLEKTFATLAGNYGYKELRTPTFEDTDVFLRTAGETSDIVTKEMYTFTDKGDRSITLKPEGTAPAMRAVVEHSLCPPGAIQKMWYIIPIFRYGRPQKGRLREAHQFGLEVVGSGSVMADAEVIELTSRFFQELGIDDGIVHLNSLGREECRSRFQEAILSHMATFLSEQTDEAKAKAHKNPLGLLDSKDLGTQEALKGLAPILDYLEPESRARFDQLQQLLTDANVPYVVDNDIVRGLDYYTETVFEVLSTKLGAQSSVCGGGRYDNLVSEMGGSPTPCVGVGIGIERTLMILEAAGLEIPEERLDTFIVSASSEAIQATLAIARELRAAGLAVSSDLDARSLKSQLRQADKSGARFAVIVGGEELERGTVQVRDLAKGSQLEVPRGDLLSQFKDRARE